MIEIQDRTNTLTAQERASISEHPTPFVGKVIVGAPSKDQLKADVHACVTSPNTVCVGVDPAHRFTWTEIGVDVGVRSGDYQQVGRAGNADFKDGRWADGVNAILSRAAILSRRSESATAVVIQQPTQVIEKSVSGWAVFGVFAAIGATFLAIAFYARRQRRLAQDTIENMQRETAELASRNIREGEFTIPAGGSVRLRGTGKIGNDGRLESPVLMSPQVIVQGGNNNDFLTGMVVGDALSHRSEPPLYSHHHHHRTPTPEPSYSSSRSSGSDGGGSSFDWSSGGGGGGDFSGGDSGGGGGGDF